MNPLLLHEAIASVSLSHPEDCDCNVCRAAHGDKDALQAILIDLEQKL